MTRQLPSALIVCLVVAGSARAEQLEPEYQSAVDRGLVWLVKQQYPDGHWEANGRNYPSAMTGLAGMALLMEGSTVRDGKHAAAIRKAVDWFVARSQASGLLAQTSEPAEQRRYMYGHGYGILFLASAYGDEDDAQRRKSIEDVLTRAVEYSCKAQVRAGGWGYLYRGSGKEDDDHDEGSVTVTQLQALRAARNVGIKVPASTIDKAKAYLEKHTGPSGGVYYSSRRKNEMSAITASAVGSGFSIGEYDSPIVKKWLRYCRPHLKPLGQGMGHSEYSHYYYAQTIYFLGEKGYARLFPDDKEQDHVTWSKYRKTTFDTILKQQKDDGSWHGNGTGFSYIGPVFVTATYLSTLQLDRNVLPIYQR